MLQAFYHRNLKPERRRLLTLIALTAQIYQGLAEAVPMKFVLPARAASP